MKLVGEVGNWKIVAHIAFKFYSIASKTFSTGSTRRLSSRGPRAGRAGPKSCLKPHVRPVSVHNPKCRPTSRSATPREMQNNL